MITETTGYNLGGLEVPANSCNFVLAGDVIANPLLGALANNGGQTRTRALMQGSPAIDVQVSGCPATDQRGNVRPDDTDGELNCDIGAYESDYPE